ncbi:chemotaxis response regulator protein-glutamate methylesterase [Peribacillus sp. SCS-37]|uniref:protein-glutamate methylesterase/protein-glutamine glutaminase n=1 Tax=Paraperibacillus esterisolvens TaxID=3115296 RepID=UPI003906CD45
MEPIKVLVVDDSAFMRKLITGFLEEDPRTMVAGTARNGKEALQKVKELKPDVVTLDIEMPLMDGLEALKMIMEACPVPCIMLSSTTTAGADNTMKAIELGAFDFVPKPSGPISLDLEKVKCSLLDKVAEASRMDVKQLMRARARGRRQMLYPMPQTNGMPEIDKNFAGIKKVICIGTSTGGPGALQHVLSSLPEDIGVPILIVQHMPEGFTASLAKRLNTLSRIIVKEAEDGELLLKGTAYIAPGGFHLKVRKAGLSLAAVLSREKPRQGHRPSVDVLFESLAEQQDYAKIAVIMTGMGHDGSKGLKALKTSGRLMAIAESKESSVVFGMPKAAIATGLVDRVENVDNIASAVINFSKN